MNKAQPDNQDHMKARFLNPDLLAACIHCGMCLPACPTYLASGREMESPRGRIYLLTQLNRGALEFDDRLSSHIESCLGCLGCESACPSGVQYGRILDEVRPALANRRNWMKRMVARLIFKSVLPNYTLLRILGVLLGFWQWCQGPWLLTKCKPIKWLAYPIARTQELLPRILPYRAFAKPTELPEPKVNLFTGCVMDIFYNQVNHACYNLLALQGNSVCIPKQTCCGALAYHAGEVDIAKQLAKRNLQYFQENSAPVVVTAAGCGAMLKDYAHLLSDDPLWADRACEFSHRVQDITENLAYGNFSVQPTPLYRKVAYHAACHLAHAQGIRTTVGDLLTGLKGIEVVPLTEFEHCCGSAGVYNLSHAKLSDEILERKIINIENTGANEVVTTNPGCMLQIQAGLTRHNSAIKVRHVAELLEEAYRGQ